MLERRRSGLRYMFVDEIVGPVVGLALYEWPGVDEKGRLRFRGSAQLLGAGTADLQHFLVTHRRPKDAVVRPVRIGDVFGVDVNSDALASVGEVLEEQRRLEPLLPVSMWIVPPVYDLTAEARDIAKI